MRRARRLSMGRGRPFSRRALAVALGVAALVAGLALVVRGRGMGGQVSPRGRTAFTTVFLQRTTPVGQNPFALADDASSGRVFVVNQGPLDAHRSPVGRGSVGVLDAASGRVLRTVPLGVVRYLGRGGDLDTLPTSARLVAVDARAGRVFVIVDAGRPDAYGRPVGRGSVGVLDAATGTVLGTTAVGAGPIALAADERSAHVFVANSLDNTVSVLDAVTGALVRTVPVGQAPDALAVDAGRGRVFVGAAGSVGILDAATGAVRRVVSLASGGCAAGICGLAVDTRTGRVIVDQSVDRQTSRLEVLDGASGRILSSATLAGQQCCPIAVDQRSDHAFVYHDPPYQSGASGAVTTLDLSTGRVVRTVGVGTNATELVDADLAADESGGRVYVATQDLYDIASARGALAMLDATSGRVLQTTGLGTGPPRIVVDPRSGHVVVLNASDSTVSIFAPG